MTFFNFWEVSACAKSTQPRKSPSVWCYLYKYIVESTPRTWYLQAAFVSLLLWHEFKHIFCIPVFHPSNTIQVTQTGFIFWGRTRILSRAISSPTALFSIWSCCCIDIQTFWKKTLKDASRLARFKIKYLQFYKVVS